MKSLTKYLTLPFLFLLASCDDTRYYYTAAAGEKAIATDTNMPEVPGLRIVGSYSIDAQILAVDRSKMAIAISMRLIPKKAEDLAIELSCLEFEVVVGDKKLNKTKEFCPTGADLLSKKQIWAEFATPDGPPLTVNVKIPAIKIKSQESNSFLLDSYSVGFQLHQYKQGFSVR